MGLFRRDKRPVQRHPTEAAPDARIWGRSYRGPAPWVWGLFVAVLIGIGVYLAFSKQIPFTSPGYELHAKFENAATLRPSSPVRIAGVNVGKVTGVEADGDAVDVTFTVSDEGQPIHSDATIEIRPRLFLEGNFFLDVEPGSPQSPGLDSGGTIPVTQTATAVQIDEVLTALQQPQRKGLQKALDGFATGLTYEPTAADDVDQTPDVQGKTGAEALQQALRYGGPAGRDTSLVNQALLGNGPHDLSQLIAALQAVFGKLEPHEEALKGLITNFNVTTGALAAESNNLEQTIAELPPTLETARPSLAELSRALPSVRALAITLRPSIAELPATIDAAEPWLDQARPLISEAELGGLAKLLQKATPPLAQTAVDSAGLFDQTEAFSRCVSNNLVPTGDVVIDNNGGAYPFGDGAAGFPSGVSNFQEFLSNLVNQAGSGQSFDGNGSQLRVNAGGGGVLGSTPYPQGSFRNTTLFGNNQSDPLGTRPTFTAATPPYRPEIPCASNPLPDINGTGGTGLPGDVGPPSPQAVP
jgi:phospholipid/cholesterol/gamma-HCH transport system substrate-binding protein